MNAITTIVTAIALGAAMDLNAEQTIRELYEDIKKHLQDQYPQAKASLEALENKPDSSYKRDSLKEDLHAVAEDRLLLQQARTLLAVIKEFMPQLAETIGMSWAEIEGKDAGELRLQKFEPEISETKVLTQSPITGNQNIAQPQAEYLAVAPAAQSSPHKWRFLIMGLSVLVLLFFGLQLGRQWYDSLMARLDAAQAVHTDQSKVNIAVKTEVKPTIQLVTHYQNGETHRVLVDAEQYSKFVTENFVELEQLRQQLQTQTRQALTEKLNPIFQAMQQRIPNFAEWYFAYSTTYELLLKAVSSATKNTFSSGAQNLSDAVAYDLQKVIQQQYDKIILQPEITHPAIEAVYSEQLKQAHSHWLESLTKVEEKFQVFVKQETTHVENNASQATLELDWKSNLNKINFANYQKNGTEAWRGALLAAGSGLTGKVIGSAIAKGIATHVESGLISKLASPFIAKALTIAGGGAVGAVGGPLGVAVGLAGGLGLDYAINKGVALMQRDEFINNTNVALQSSRMIWEKALQESMAQTVQIWFDDSIQLLPRYDKTVHKPL